MKATELRIGNYFKPDMFGGAEHDVITADDIVKIHDDPQDDYYQPLPLTPGWLEKCGFKKDDGNFKGETIYVKGIYFITELFGFYLTIGWDDEAEMSFSGYQINDGDNEIKNLHQLQNLYFALTGEELTVNL